MELTELIAESEPPGGEALSAAVRNASMRSGKSEGENCSGDQDSQSRGSRHVAGRESHSECCRDNCCDQSNSAQ